MIQIPRGDLGILGTSKGLIIGNVSFKMFSGETIDCKGGQCIPNEIDDIHEIEINEFEDATKVVELPSILRIIDFGPLRAISAYSKTFLLYKYI